MDDYVVSEETDEMVGLKIVDDGDCILLVDINTLDDEDVSDYVILKSDIPRLIEGLKTFLE